MIEKNSEINYLLRMDKEHEEWKARHEPKQLTDIDIKLQNHIEQIQHELYSVGMLVGYVMKKLHWTDEERKELEILVGLPADIEMKYKK